LITPLRPSLSPPGPKVPMVALREPSPLFSLFERFPPAELYLFFFLREMARKASSFSHKFFSPIQPPHLDFRGLFPFLDGFRTSFIPNVFTLIATRSPHCPFRFLGVSFTSQSFWYGIPILFFLSGLSEFSLPVPLPRVLFVLTLYCPSPHSKIISLARPTLLQTLGFARQSDSSLLSDTGLWFFLVVCSRIGLFFLSGFPFLFCLSRLTPLDPFSHVLSAAVFEAEFGLFPNFRDYPDCWAPSSGPRGTCADSFLIPCVQVTSLNLYPPDALLP